MSPSLIAASALTCLCLAGPSLGAPSAPDGEARPVNASCPISKEPIVPAAGTVEHDGHAIGLCCRGCGKQFQAWDETRRDEFVALTLAGQEPGKERSGGSPTEPEAWTDPYPLDTCPVGGGKLGSMGDPVVKVYDGREVRFCCSGCIGKFDASRESYWKAIDEEIVRDQLPYYPTDTCIVMGDPLTEDGEDIATNVVYGNRLVRLCCRMCERKFKANPGKFIETLDKATADAQRADYPLDTCIVAGSKLGSMGDPAEMVVAGRLLRFCCAGCMPKVEAAPSKYIATIDKAWRAQGKFMPSGHEGEHGHDGGPGHGHDHDHDHGG